MRISQRKLKCLCKRRDLTVKGLLSRACVSRTAFYSLFRKETVLPRSLHRMAQTLGVKPSAFLEEESAEEKKLRRLRRRVEAVLNRHPEADRENVWHTLLLLEEPPIERLRRGLLRAQKFDFH